MQPLTKEQYELAVRERTSQNIEYWIKFINDQLLANVTAYGFDILVNPVASDELERHMPLLRSLYPWLDITYTDTLYSKAIHVKVKQ